MWSVFEKPRIGNKRGDEGIRKVEYGRSDILHSKFQILDEM